MSNNIYGVSLGFVDRICLKIGDTDGQKKLKAASKKAAKRAVKKVKKPKVVAKDEINFDCIKSNQFRVIRVDGAHGGIVPGANGIQMAFFSERRAIPKRETYKLKNGRLDKLLATEKRNAIIREVEALIDLRTAKVIVEWLEEKIEQAENLQRELKVK